MKKSSKLKLIALISIVPIILVLGLYLFTGENRDILREVFSGGLTTEEIRAHLSALGIRGRVTVSVLSMLQVALAFLPAEPVQVIAGLSFGFLDGAIACTVGVFLGRSLIYFLYKSFGDTLREYFDKNLSIDLSGIGRSGKLVIAILILYLLPAIPYGMICFLAATSGMKYHRYAIVTTVGAIPSVCIGVGLGHMALSASWVISVIVFAAIVVLLALVFSKREYLLAKLREFLDKAREPDSSKTVVKSYKSSRLLLPYIGFRLLCIGKLKFKMKRNVETVEHPSIVLCNHGAFVDFAYAGSLLRKDSPNFIVARLYFYKRILSLILKEVGCFPKSMFTLDTESVVNCMRVVKGGGVLAMMPEARLSTVGRFEDIQESTYAFLKKMGVTVYAIKIHGDYLAKPKWASKMRRGSLVEAELNLLIEKDELATMDISEIKERVESALRYDEFEWLKTHPEIRYHSRQLARGLENVLTRCPCCNSKYTIRTSGRRVFCESCELIATLDSRYSFVSGRPFENFADWYDWQYELIKSEILSNKDFSLSSHVELRHASKDGKTLLTLAGEGECTLDRTGLTYVGSEYGENIEKHFPISTIYRLLFGAGEDFEVYLGREIYYFTPQNRQSCVDWYIASAIIYDESKNSAEGLQDDKK